MKKSIIVLLLFIQFSSIAQRLVKEECIGTINNEEIVTVHENNDSTSTIIYSESVQGIPAKKLKAVKLDKNRDVIINKYIDNINYDVTSLKDIVHFQPDGSFMIVINTISDTFVHFKFALYNNNVNQEWSTADSFSTNYYLYLLPTNKSFIAQKTEGGFIVLVVCEGHTYTETYSIFSISENGHIEWQKNLSIFGGYYLDLVQAAIIPKPNKKTFIYLNSGEFSIIFGYSGSHKKCVVLDSLGNIEAEKNIDTPFGITDYSEQFMNDTVVSTYNLTNFPLYYSLNNSVLQFKLINTENLDIIREDSIVASEGNLLYARENNLSDSSNLFFFSAGFIIGNVNRYILCKDISGNTLWDYAYTLDSATMEPFSYRFPIVIDNNTIYADNRLIRNGAEVWHYNIRQSDTIIYNGQTVTSSLYSIYKSNDNQYLNIHRVYDLNMVRFIVLDINTGNTVVDFFLDGDKAENIAYLKYIGNRNIFAASNNYTICRFGGSDVYLATYSNEYNLIKGIAYIDYNNNNVKESNEPVYPYGYVTTTSTNDIQTQHLSTASPFNFFTNTGVYTTSLHLYNDYYTYQPAQFVTSHFDYGNTDTLLFALHPKSNMNDISIQLVNNWMTRLGQNNSYTVSIENKGTAIANGKVSVLMDERLLNITASPNYTYRIGDTLVWNIGNMAPVQKRVGTVNFTAETPPELIAGDTLISKAWYTSDSVDATPADNYTEVKEIIRASYDPNEKAITSGEILTPTQVSNGNYISYVIHFQNKGNDTAFKVIVMDTLSNNVDINSLEIINASHNYTLEIIQNKILKFTFNNIRLSYDTLSLSSTGFIAYKIKPKTSLSLGNTINNTAYIYFDYNEPIQTNTVQTQILLLSAINSTKNATGKINIYPNPNNGIFTISFENKNNSTIHLQLIDVTGNNIYRETKHHNGKSEFTINQTNLAKGIYWIKLTNGKDILSSVVIIQ